MEFGIRKVALSLVVRGVIDRCRDFASTLLARPLAFNCRVGSALPLVLCLVLVAGAVRSAVELGATRRRGRGTSDADALARLTHVPAALWVAAFVAVTAAAAVATALVLGLLGFVR